MSRTIKVSDNHYVDLDLLKDIIVEEYLTTDDNNSRVKRIRVCFYFPNYEDWFYVDNAFGREFKDKADAELWVKKYIFKEED